MLHSVFIIMSTVVVTQPSTVQIVKRMDVIELGLFENLIKKVVQSCKKCAEFPSSCQVKAVFLQIEFYISWQNGFVDFL